MAIEITCTGCGKVLHVPDAAAGKKGKCPHCGTTLQVPASEEQPFIKAVPPQTQPPPPPMTQWYVLLDNGTRSGPFTQDQLGSMIQAGQVGSNTRVWRMGCADWAMASTFDAWRPLFAVLPPPAPPMTTPPPAATVSTGAGTSAPKRWSGMAISGFILSIFCLVIPNGPGDLPPDKVWALYFGFLILSEIGTTLSAVGFARIKTGIRLRGFGLAIAGLVINIVCIVMYFVTWRTGLKYTEKPYEFDQASTIMLVFATLVLIVFAALLWPRQKDS